MNKLKIYFMDFPFVVHREVYFDLYLTFSIWSWRIWTENFT